MRTAGPYAAAASEVRARPMGTTASISQAWPSPSCRCPPAAVRLPLSACRREIAAGRLRYAPVHDPGLTQQLGLAATSQFSLSRGLGIRIGEVARLIACGSWRARVG